MANKFLQPTSTRNLFFSPPARPPTPLHPPRSPKKTINGDNLSNSINNLAVNITIGAVANAAAKEIGNAAHPTDHYGNALPSQINKATQLTLHATLGCATGAASGGNCGAGAAAGVIGEMVGEALKDSVINQSMSRQHAIQLAGLSGSAASLLASSATGQSDQQTANNIFVGQRIGGNAAANNALMVWVQPVAAGNYHTSIKIEPEDQEKYANDPRFQNIDENGRRYATIGGGPDGPTLTLGNLIGGETPSGKMDGINRARDIDLNNKVWESQTLVSPSAEDSYIDKLFKINSGYKNNLDYELFPTKNSNSYNSNSYTAGVLEAAGITPPKLPTITTQGYWQDSEYPERSGSINFKYTLPQFQTPGYNKPVPLKYFGSQE